MSFPSFFYNSCQNSTTTSFSTPCRNKFKTPTSSLDPPPTKNVDPHLHFDNSITADLGMLKPDFLENRFSIVENKFKTGFRF